LPVAGVKIEQDATYGRAARKGIQALPRKVPVGVVQSSVGQSRHYVTVALKAIQQFAKAGATLTVDVFELIILGSVHGSIQCARVTAVLSG
jgi:hypothetical protein